MIKKLEILFPVAALFLVILIEWGCQGNKPLSPSRNVSLNIHIPRTNEVKASLLGAVQNEVICRVDGPGSTLLTEATVGPFSTAANYGSEDLTVVIPQADNLLLSLQLNDAASHQPLAVGAVAMDLLSSPVSDVVVEMGSVARNCYFVKETPPLGQTGSAYAFGTDNLFNQLSTSGYDVAFSPLSTIGYQMVDAQASSTGALSSIAFLGNGELVDHDRTPPNNNYFFTNSAAAKQYAVSTGFAAASATTNVEAGDIYFVNLKSIASAHAWVQVTDPGFLSTITPGYGPSFRFRVNGTLPYYGYDQTTADISGACTAY